MPPRTTNRIRPMLAVNAPSLSTLRYPVYAGPKLDGIRCILVNGEVLSRSLEPIPNDFVRSELAGYPDGLDGELIVGDPLAAGAYDRTQSGVMTVAGEPDFTFNVFDDYLFPGQYEKRYLSVLSRYLPSRKRAVKRLPNKRVIPIVHEIITSEDELHAYADNMIMGLGHEGVMIKDPRGYYKRGKTTANEGWMLRLKKFDDLEAVVIGITEKTQNTEKSTRDRRGYAKRGKKKEFLVGTGTLGAFICRMESGVEFKCGTGLSAAQRLHYWNNPPIGELIKVKYMEITKTGKPRHPVFLGLRSKIDL